jgi:hypothetical protein
MCLSVVRLEFNSRLVMGNSSSGLSHSEESIPKIIMCFGVVRLEFNSLLVVGNSFLSLSLEK